MLNVLFFSIYTHGGKVSGKGIKGGIEMDSCGKKFIGRVLNAGDRQEHDEDSEEIKSLCHG